VALTAFSARSEENDRRAKDELYSIMNARKGRLGAFEALLNPEVMQRKRDAEEKLKQGKTKEAFERIAAAQKVIGGNALRLNLLENRQGLASRSFAIARTLVRAAAERGQPNGERLREFRDSNRESLELDLFSEEPLYDDFEQAQLAHSLTFLARKLGFADPLVQKVLAGKAPTERAAELVKGTKVKTLKMRRELYQNDPASFVKSDDPMIQLAVLVDEEARAVRKTIEAQDEIKRQAHEEIAAARNALQGTAGYPDATFTLRLAFGRTAGYEENGKEVSYQTTFGGLYERAQSHNFKPPFDLPVRWRAAKDKLDLRTPFNYVATTDSIGGNSGSPMINRAGEIIGINFDRNLHGLGRDFFYTDVKARNIAVHTRAITESLRKVYGAEDLARKLSTGK
ncbi:MAG TPA: S46 family peptidase, partial [Verrucomicrobiae bacterium]|nr:S46 family peptidase [Verrucomicrobiae bacterium]